MTDRHGEEREVGAYALHIDCPWRLTDPAGAEFAYDESAEWRYQALEDQHLTVERIVSAADHGMVIRFIDGWVLEVSPDDDEDGEAVEYWRMFEPYQDRPHLIARSSGIDLEVNISNDR